jgi:hypothetical protein
VAQLKDWRLLTAVAPFIAVKDLLTEPPEVSDFDLPGGFVRFACARDELRERATLEML